MPGTIRFSRGINLAGQRSSEPPRETTSLIDLLNTVQRKDISFLPVSPQSGLGIVGRGLSGDIYQSTADAVTTFTFKNGIPSRLWRDNEHVQDWYSLVTQLSVLQYGPIRDSPHIIDIVGISWNVELPAMRAWPYLVMSKVDRGSLSQFLLENDITDEVRFKICSQVVGAFALLHSCGVGHGDIKPDNILLDEDQEGELCCKVADFGSCAIRGQERVPEGTLLWRAPELSLYQRRHVTAEEAICSDLYSIGLLISQVLISNVNLTEADLWLLQPTATTSRTLASLQKEKALVPKMLSLARSSNLSPQNYEILEEILSASLHRDPSLRGIDWSKVLTLTNIDIKLGGEKVVAPKLPTASSRSGSPVPCLHEIFDLAASLGEYDDFDYVVRDNTGAELEFKAKSTTCSDCARRYAFQLALCYKIGFGVKRDLDISRSWLVKAALGERDLQSAIKGLAERYVLTGRLTDQVRNALGIGVLISADLTQQYQLQGRTLKAEKSLSSEISARESELGSLHICLSKLKSDLAQIYKAQGRLGEAKKLQKEIVMICSGKYGERHPSTLAAQASLAAILADEGSLVEAETVQRELQPMFEEVLGEEHPETVIAFQSWGVTLHSQGRHQEATDIFRKIKALRTKTLTDSHPLTIRADICLAAALHGQGLLQEADQLMSRIASNSAHSGDAVIEAHVQMNLANLFRDQNRMQEAEKAASQAIKILRKRSVPMDDPMRLSAEEVLAVVCGEKREFARQEKLLRAILQAKAGHDQGTPSVSNTRTSLASNLLKQGRLEDSVVEADAVLDTLKQSLALDPENFLACTEILATVNSRQGKLKEAEKLRSELLVAYAHDLGHSHPFTLHARSSLADFYAEQGRFAEAAELQEHNLRTLEDTNQSVRSTVRTARELALTYRELSRFEAAVELCNKGLEWSRKAVGEEHIDTVAVYNILAGSYLQWGRLADANAVYESSVVPHVAGTDLEIYVLETMAELRRAQGRTAESMELSQKALGLTFQRLGQKHPASIKMVGNMLGSRLGQEPLTEELEQEVLANIQVKKEILGPSHFSTIKTQSDLAYAYSQQGRLNDAEALYDTMEGDNGQGVNLENSLRYATYLAKRADLYFQSGDYPRVQAMEEQALAIRQGLLPPEHSAVLVSMMNLASTLNAQRKHDDAEILLRHVISLREMHLSPDAAPTLAAKSDLAAVLYFQDKLAESEALYAVVLEASQRMNVSPALLQQRMAQLLKVQEAQNQLRIAVMEDVT